MTLPTLTKSSSSSYVEQQRLPSSDIDILCTNQQLKQQSPSIVIDFNQLSVENIMPGIYFTKNFTVWSEDKLRSHGFTHIIIIDKHIQDLHHSSFGDRTSFKLPNATINTDEYDDHQSYSSISRAFYYTSDSIHNVRSKSLNFGKEFEIIELNFGEKNFPSVLPNCYKAVKFIDKALQSGGTILIIDCNGVEQKCLTITVAYLMYKNNLSFRDAFNRLINFYKKADLDKFYISQLYEYEPILQVQRAHSRGHSCSREMHSAILKRKRLHDEWNRGIMVDSGMSDSNNNNNNYNNNNNNTCNINTDFSNQMYFHHHSPYKTTRCSYTISDDSAME